jgi:trk system potassium uptake protein TrkH
LQDTLKSLHFAVRAKTLAKYLGLLSLMVACLAVVPFLVSLWFGEYELSKRYLIVIALLVVMGLPSLRLSHPADIQDNESLAVTALAFVFTPLIMSYPMMGSGLSFMDAWFEAVSAITTTGLSTVSHLERMPQTFLFARAWMQWYGGLGILVFSVAIVMNHHIALRRLINPTGENLYTTTRVYARRMLSVYVTLTLLGLGLLLFTLDDAFAALAHTLAAISTGGFSPENNSLAGLPWQAQFSITLLGLCGAIPFVLYYRLTHGGWREALADFEMRALLGLTLLVCLLLSASLALQSSMSWLEAIRQGTLLGISAQTTTGFASLDIRHLNSLSLGVVMVAMVIGGGVGSTAGGFKILRLLILLRLIQWLLQHTAMPTHAVSEPRLGDKTLEGDEIQRALLLILLFLMVIAISWLIFLAHGYDPMRALFEVTSAAGTVGLSSGLTSHELEPLLKGVLCVNMLLGRVEIIALLVVLYPGTWIGKRTE